MASRISGVSSEWAQSSTALDQNIYKPTMDDRLTDIKNFFYDSNTGELFGCRTPLQWLLVIIYHIVFYIALLVLFTGFMLIFFWIVDWNYPTMQGVDSILKVPGLSFRPMPVSRSTVVRFVKGDASTYTQYLDHMEAYLRYYENENQQGDNYIDCSKIRTRRTTGLSKVCRFGIEKLGSSCVKQQNFGFDDGQPCILLKLNKIYNWIPEEFTNETMPADYIGDLWEQWHITVKCYGENEVDRENMGPLTYHPPNGFPFKYYPYLNQQGYRSPLMFVRFETPVPGILLMITCKAYANNIYHNKVELAGMVHFELLVD